MTKETLGEGVPVTSGASRRRLILYLLPLVLGPFLLLIAAPFVLPSAWFIRHAQDPWLVGIGYGNDLHHEDCQVVIYGDSTAEVGVDPEVIRQRTGLSACNIAQEQGLRLLSGDFVLDNYLRQNSKPKFLIMLFGPADFSKEGARNQNPIFEALNWEIGQGHREAALASLVHDPEDVFRWAYKGMHIAILNARVKPIPATGLSVRERTHGQLLLEDQPMGSYCTDSVHVPPPDRSLVDSLRSKYSGAADELLIDVMPLPDCDPGFAITQQRFTGLVDNKVTQLPHDVYFRGGLHVNGTGSRLLSDQLAQQILEKMGTPPTQASPASGPVAMLPALHNQQPSPSGAKHEIMGKAL
jgi:hypothetical protein